MALRDKFIEAPSAKSVIVFFQSTGPKNLLEPNPDVALSMDATSYGGLWTIWQNAQDDAAKEEILARLGAHRKVEVFRFKGLGEMDAKQLKETTLDPSVRVLLRVDIESQLEADQTFQQLLGKDASERYRVIMDEAAFADDLDV